MLYVRDKYYCIRKCKSLYIVQIQIYIYTKYIYIYIYIYLQIIYTCVLH